MEVTCDNFEQIYPKIISDIGESSFVALDFEFTGINFDECCLPTLFDSIEEHYEKLVKAAVNFVPCQIGLSTFTKNSETNSFNVSIYSFHLFPRFVGRGNSRFSVDPQSAQFLADNGFDFNKFISKGISYLNENGEQEMNEVVDNLLSMDMTRSISSALSLLNSELSNWHHRIKSSRSNETETRVKYKSFTNDLDNYTTFLRLNQIFPELWCEQNPQKSDELTVKFYRNSERNELKEKLDCEKERMKNYLRGFSRIVKFISENRKIIVGFNMMMDLLFMYHHLIRPLPPKLTQFKKEILAAFPNIYDGKTVHMRLKRDLGEFVDFLDAGGLLELYDNLDKDRFFKASKNQPLIRLAQQKDLKYLPHDAAFDSYMTGFVFIRMAYLLTNRLRVVEKCRFPNLPPNWSEIEKNIHPFRNLINLIRAVVHRLDLECDKHENVRPDWLLFKSKNNTHVKVLRAELNNFTKFGTIDYRELSANEALVAVAHERLLKDIIVAFRDDARFNVYKYSELRHSPLRKACLWSTFFVASTISSYLVLKMMQFTKLGTA